MMRLKAKWRSLVVDLCSWAYLGFLVMSQEYSWAAIWFVSVLILNLAYYLKPRYVTIIQFNN